MAIYRQLRETAFEPAEIVTMAAAYEEILLKLHLKNRDDPVTELVAQKVIALFNPGESDPDALCQRVLKSLHIPTDH
jgi:hypothetical protein